MEIRYVLPVEFRKAEKEATLEQRQEWSDKGYPRYKGKGGIPYKGEFITMNFKKIKS